MHVFLPRSAVDQLCPNGAWAAGLPDPHHRKLAGDKVFTPKRLQTMIAGAQKHLRGTRPEHDSKLKVLAKELGELKTRSDRLFDAVVRGLLPLDTALQQRSHELQARQQELLLEVAAIKRHNETPLTQLKTGQVEAFGKALKSRLVAHSPFARQYLRLLVTRIRVSRDNVEMRGSYGDVAGVIQARRGALPMVPSFAPRWLPDQGKTGHHWEWTVPP